MPEIRRARPEELEEVGRTTVAAYTAYLDEDGGERLRHAPA